MQSSLKYQICLKFLFKNVNKFILSFDFQKYNLHLFYLGFIRNK